MELWPGAFVYLRANDTYPRSGTGAIYAPEKAEDGSYTVRFALDANDRGADGQITTGKIEGTATVVLAEPATALYQSGECSVLLHAVHAGGVFEAQIDVTESAGCGPVAGADVSGIYRPTLIGP
jgi:hypothetical protein